jgi:transposase
MELFRAEKIAEIESRSSKRCRVCGNTLRLLRVVHFPDRAAAIRAFECECGERIWDE